MNIHPIIPVIIGFMAFLLAFTSHPGWLLVSAAAFLFWGGNFLRWIFD